MAVTKYLNSALEIIESQLRLKRGITIETLAGTFTFGPDTPNVGSFDPNGSDRNMQLEAEEKCEGFFGMYYNAGTVAANLVFLNDAAGTVATLNMGEWMVLACDGVAWAAFPVTAFADYLATPNTWTAKQTFSAVRLGGIVDSPVTAVQVLVSTDTITLPTTGKNKRLSSVAAVTGIILTVGTVDGQDITLFNVNAANSITFNTTPGTSKVARAASVIAAGSAVRLVWDSTSTLWYPT